MKSFTIKGDANRELEAMAQTSGRSEINLIRGGLALMKVALEAQKSGKKLLLSDSNYENSQEIVIPQ